MGHLRLGRLPKTRRWIEVVELLEADPTDAARVTGATVVAAETHLRSLPSNEPLTYAYWLLLRIATASRSETFVQDVRGLGLSVTAETSALELISEVADELRGRFRGGDSATAEFASLAVRRALTETVGSFGGSLFGSTVDACLVVSSPHPLRSWSLQHSRGGSDYYSRAAKPPVWLTIRWGSAQSAWANPNKPRGYAADLFGRCSAQYLPAVVLRRPLG